MQILARDGLHLPQYDLWLDPHRARGAAWVSHAHADHMKRHGRVWATRATAAMMRARGATKTHFHTLDWGEEVAWNGARVSLFPAGHVLGSSQMLVEGRDGEKLLYSGDFKLRPGRSCETIEVPRADVVVMETTFGRPRYRFPEIEDVLRDICGWCRKVLDAGEVPVLFCYSLGKGQEILSGLHDCGFPIYLHAKHDQISAVYAEMGVSFPEFGVHQAGQKLDGVLLCAKQCRRSKWWRELETQQHVRTATVSGWALDGRPWDVDAAFALSDHAGYDDLLEYVRLSGARQVWTTHGFDEEFAADLRVRGLDAAPLQSLARSRASLKNDDAPLQLALF